MERLQIAVCEDNKEERARLLRMILAVSDLAVVEAFESAEDLLKAFYPQKYDLIIFDIFMTGMTGIDALEQIRKSDMRVVAAIATTSQDFALESYRLHAARYLEKPVGEEEIRDLLQFVISRKESEPHYECVTEKGRVRIPFDCIQYVEQRGKFLVIHDGNQPDVITRGKLDAEQKAFPDRFFYRCHKSYLVNLSKIRSIDRELLTFVMENREHVHIHRQGFFAAKRAYEQYLYSIAEGWKKKDDTDAYWTVDDDRRRICERRTD